MRFIYNLQFKVNAATIIAAYLYVELLLTIEYQNGWQRGLIFL